MCGIRIDRRMQERRGGEQKIRATAMANAQLPTPEARKTVVHPPQIERSPVTTMGATALAERPELEVEQRRAPVASVGGPSFLGLNEPQPEGDYLLEEEGSSGRGIRTLVLLVILIAILGLIFVQYRSNLSASPKPPDQPKTSPASTPQSHGKNQQPGSEKALSTIAGASTLQAAAAEVAKAANSTAADKNTDKDSDAVAEKPVKSKVPAKAAEDVTVRSKPDPAAETRNQPSAALVKAQQYLHGRGVRQNCEQGLMYLKAATRENDPQAAVQMAALYSSGFCVRQDRVQAYRWFSSAQEMNPQNRWITKNMSQLWAQMTPQERRQIH